MKNFNPDPILPDAAPDLSNVAHVQVIVRVAIGRPDLQPAVHGSSNVEGATVDGPTVVQALLSAVGGLYGAANAGMPAEKPKQGIVIPFSAHGVPMRG